MPGTDAESKGTDMTMTNPTKPLLIAHRGASRDAPENTLAAFDLAWHQGADGIEADFRLTRDGRIICLHDATTGRTADVDLVVAESDCAELQQLDVGGWQGARWQGERIQTLEEVLARLSAGKLFLIELKSGPEIIAPLARLLAASTIPATQLRLLAFDCQLVARLKEQLSDIRVCLNVDYRWHWSTHSWRPTRAEVLSVMEQCGADGLSSRANPQLDALFIAELQQRGKEVYVWTVDLSRSAANYRALGVDGIMTNRPGWLRRKLLPAGSIMAAEGGTR